MTAPDRAAIAGRIRALRAKTVANGCTEAEAIAAAEMLAKLLARYNMTLDEAELRDSPFKRHSEEHTDWTGERLWKVADAAAHLTDSRYWQSAPGIHPVEINFFGFAHEVEVAAYLLEVCAQAMRREQQRIIDTTPRLFTTARQRRAVAPFLDGMADRLHTRIRALKPAMPPGTGLMVLRSELITRAMKEERLRTRAGGARGSRDREAGYFSGIAAADRVALNPGVRGPGSSAARLADAGS